MNESKNSGEVEEVIPALLAVLMGVLHFDLDMKDFSYSLSELTDSKFIIFLDRDKLLYLFGNKLNIIRLNEKYLILLEIIINLMYVIEHHSFYRNSGSCFFFFWKRVQAVPVNVPEKLPECPVKFIRGYWLTAREPSGRWGSARASTVWMLKTGLMRSHG